MKAVDFHISSKSWKRLEQIPKIQSLVNNAVS